MVGCLAGERGAPERPRSRRARCAPRCPCRVTLLRSPRPLCPVHALSQAYLASSKTSSPPFSKKNLPKIPTWTGLKWHSENSQSQQSCGVFCHECLGRCFSSFSKGRNASPASFFIRKVCSRCVNFFFARSKAPCSRLVWLIPLRSPHSKGVLERAKFGHIVRVGFVL